MAMQHTGYQQAEKTSWSSLSFFALIQLTWIPMLVASIVLIGLAWWYSAYEPFSQNIYNGIVFGVYCAIFIGYCVTLLRRASFSRNHVVVIMGFLGFGVGLLLAIGKIAILFRGWAFLRLISEPILTALLAGIIGALIFWRRGQLNFRK